MEVPPQKIMTRSHGCAWKRRASICQHVPYLFLQCRQGRVRFVNQIENASLAHRVTPHDWTRLTCNYSVWCLRDMDLKAETHLPTSIWLCMCRPKLKKNQLFWARFFSQKRSLKRSYPRNKTKLCVQMKSTQMKSPRFFSPAKRSHHLTHQTLRSESMHHLYKV